MLNVGVIDVGFMGIIPIWLLPDDTRLPKCPTD